jgi:hypothetical protein
MHMPEHEPGPVGPTPEQTAEYTYDMLLALKELASVRGQETLVALLSAAAAEARALARAPATRPAARMRSGA